MYFSSVFAGKKRLHPRAFRVHAAPILPEVLSVRRLVWNWKLNREDIVVGPINSDELTKKPSFAREGRAHLSIYQALSAAHAVIHTHPFHVLPFCVAQKAIGPALDATMRLGTIDLAKHVSSWCS